MAAAAGIVTAAPALVVVLGSAILAAFLVGTLWWLVGHAITIAHEGGHALIAVLIGGRVTHVQLGRDRTGETRHNIIGGIARLPVTFAGYIAPSVFGFLASIALAHGNADLVLWMSVVLLIMLFTVTGNWFGGLTVVVTGLILLLTAVRGSVGLQLLVACTWTWLLLLGGLVHILIHGNRGDDFVSLRKRTWLPATFWALLSVLIAATALAAGGLILLGMLSIPAETTT